MLTPLERAKDIGNRLNGGYCLLYQGTMPADIFDDALSSRFLCRLEFVDTPCYRVEGNEVVLVEHKGEAEESGTIEWYRYFSADGKPVMQNIADALNLNKTELQAGGTVKIVENRFTGNINVYMRY